MKARESNKIVERYVEWFRDNIKVRNISKNLTVLQSPFVDSHNDFITIYIKKRKMDHTLLQMMEELTMI